MIGPGLLLAAAALQVADAPVADSFRYAVYGVGLRSCGEWTSDRRANGADAIIKLTWLGGYLSGQNAVLSAALNRTVDILEGTDLNGAAAWIDNYCAAEPLASLSTAAQALSAELMGRRDHL